MRNFIEHVYSLIPASYPRYKLAKGDFHTATTSDHAYLMLETSRLFEWLGLTRLDPQAEIRELRQMTLYRPDTYHILHHLATIIVYLFHFDNRILSDSHLGEAPIERLISLFLKNPNRFTPNGRPLLAGPFKAQHAMESTTIASDNRNPLSIEIFPSTTIFANTSSDTSQNTQIANQTAISSFDIKAHACRSIVEHQFSRLDGTIQREDEIAICRSRSVQSRLDQNEESNHAKADCTFQENESV